MIRTLQAILLITFVTVSAPNIAAEFQAHDDIRDAVRTFVNQHMTERAGIEVVIDIGNIDSRLRLTQCEKPLETFSQINGQLNSRFSVGVKCEGNKPWSLYLPVTVQKFTNVYVAAHSLSKGETVNSDEIQQIRMDINKIRGGFIDDINEIKGMIVKQTISLGQPFSLRYLRPPLVVKRGENVDIVAKSRDLEIRMTGKAINSGAKGDVIRVKNSSSKRVIEAVVVNSGLVMVNL